VMTEKVHKIEFPNVSSHPEANKLRAMKEEKMDDWDAEEAEEQEDVDPDEVEKDTKRDLAQKLRDQGVTIESQDPDATDIVSTIGMSQSWVSRNTTAPSSDE